MEFTEDEIAKLKAMLFYLVSKKHQQSDGKCGFHLSELKPIMDELEKDQKVILRPTINSKMYFLTNK